MSEDIKKILEEKDKIYQRVLDLLERKAKTSKTTSDVRIGGQSKSNLTMTLEQAMNSSFDRIKTYSNKRVTNALF